MNLDNNNSSHTEVQSNPVRQLPANALSALKQSRWRRPVKILLGLIGVFFALVLLGLLLGPNLIRSQAEKQIGEQLGRHTTIGDLKLNLLSGEVTILDATIFEADNTTPFVSFKRFYINAASWASLFRLSPVLDEITLEAPKVNLVRTDATRFNFSDIVDKILAKPASEGKSHFSLNNIRLIDGAVHYQDTYSAAKPEHALTKINVAVPFVSNLDYAADLFIKPELNALLNGSPIGAKAETKPFESDKETHLQLSIDQLNLPDYLNLLPFNVASKLASAALSSDLDISFLQTGEKQQIHAKGNVLLDDLNWQQSDGQGLLKLQQIKVDINDIDVAAQQVALERISLTQPAIQLVRNSQGQLNWLNTIEQIQKNTQQQSTAPTTSATNAEKNKDNQPWAITLKELAIDGGSTSWTDETTSPTFHKTLQQINLSVKDLDTGKPQAMPIKLSANTDADEKITHEGLVNPFALTGSGTIDLAQIRIADAMPYLNPILNNPLEEGRLDAELHYELSKVNDKLNVVLKDSSASLNKLKIKSGLQPGTQPATKVVVTKNKTTGKAIASNSKSDNRNQLDLGQLQVKGIALDLAKQNFVADSVTLTGTQLVVLRDEQGQINWTKLVKSSDKPAPNTASTANANQPPTTPWQWLVKSVDISQTTINFDDLSVGKNKSDNKNTHGVHLRLDPVKLSVKNLSSQSEPIDLALDTGLNQKGKLRVKGNALLSPFSTKLDIDAQTLDLQPFTPYVDPFLNIDIASGELNAKGNVHFDAASELIKNGKKVTRPMMAAYKGQASLLKLRALDKVNSADFLKFKSLALSNIDFAMPGSNSAQSMAINVGDISLNDYYARIILNANGRINLRDIAAKPESNVSITTPDTRTAEEIKQEKEAVAAEKPAATSKPLIRIGQIGLKKGFINFTDNFIKPNYTVDLTGIEGKISKLASDSDTPADMLLQGRVSNDAPVVIEGRLNPLAANLFVDIGASAKGIELTQLTPYAAKYAGYAIDKGKLSVDLKYKVENDQLNADNKVYLDQLTFGKKIDSPDATKLPVLLAVSLLKDRNGVIDINLPISGSLSDPQFSIGGIIFKVIINLLTKAIISPFSLLASAFGGGGEELSYITFAPGLAILEDSASKKLEPIAKALLDRPALKMELTGRADPTSDLPALRKEYLNSEIRKLKLKDLSKQGKLADEDVDKPLAISDEERASYIEKIYKASKFDKPKNAIGFAKGLPTDEMTKLIEDNHAVGENDLQQLANQRASSIKHWLEDKGKIPSDRLFLIAGKTKADSEEDKESNKTAPANRVDFTLK